MKRRVKINKLPKGYMQDGGSVNKTLGSVPRQFANLEAEKGEVIATQDKGELALFTIGGKRHAEGGTPMNRPPGDFIWSDTKKMTIKDPEVLSSFGRKKPATPAKLAKKFMDTNDYRAILDDPLADDIAKNTAKAMIDTNKSKLGELAFVQESMKGFPQGIPSIAQDYAASVGVPMAQHGGLIKAQPGIQTGVPSVGAGMDPRDIANLKTYLELQSWKNNYGNNNYAYNQGLDPRLAVAFPGMASNPDVTGPRLALTPTRNEGSVQDPFGISNIDYANDPRFNYQPVDVRYNPASSDNSGSGSSSGSGRGSGSGNGGPRRTNVYDPRIMGQWQAGQDAENYDFISGSTAIVDGQAGSRPVRQAKRKDGTYGEEDLMSEAAQADFYARHPWVKEARPDFNFANSEDVAWFQKTAEQRRKDRAEELGIEYVPYFIEGDKEGRGFDAKMGEHTFNTPADAVREPEIIEEEEKEGCDCGDGTFSQECCPKETEKKIEYGDTPDTKPFEQDLRNEAVLSRNRASERRRYPWAGRLVPGAVDPTYQSDVNQQQNIQAQQAIASAAAASFADPNALMANLSKLSGLSSTKSNEIAAQIQRENTGIANEFEKMNSQLAYDAAVRNLANMQGLYDNTVKTDEVYDEKMRNYNIAQTAARNITDTNLARAKAMNKMNPLFTINTGQGPQYGDFYFQPGVSAAMFDVNDPSANEQRQAFLDAQRQAILEDPSLSAEDRSKLIMSLYQNQLGLSNKSSSGATPEQMALYNQYMGAVGAGLPGYNNPYSQGYGQQSGSMKWGGFKKKR